VKRYILYCVAFLTFSCASTEYPSGDFYAVVISDTHVSNDESKIKRLNQLCNWINTDKLLFITGDVVSSVFSEYPDTSNNRLKKAIETFSTFEVPFFPVMGNHDYKIGRNRDSDVYFPGEELRDMEQIWKKYTGFDPYYAYEHKGWHFLILNTMRGRDMHRAFDEPQLNWLEDELSNSQKAVLFFHHPVETDHFRFWCKSKDLIDEELEPRFYRLLQKHRRTVKGIFVGHGHSWIHDTLFETIQVYETESFGDASDPVYYVVGFNQATQTLVAVQNAVPPQTKRMN
jgi:hypothetical protein